MAMKTRDYLRYTSWPIIVAMVALMVFGILAIQASERSDPSMRGFTSRQIIFACVGLFIFLLATIVPYRTVGRLAYPLFGLTLVLLVLVLIIGSERGQARRWFDLKIINFQPAEATKLTFIVMLAWYLRFGDHYRRARGLVLPFILTFVPMALILREPDLGTCLLFLPMLYGMLFVAGARVRHLLSVVALATAMLLLPILWRVPANVSADNLRTRRATSYASFEVAGVDYLLVAAPLLVMRPYQVKRVEGWLRQNDPDVPRDLSHQLRVSKITLGSGGWTGQAQWHAEHGFFRMLPDDHTDFVLALIGGRWGLLGCVAVMFLYGVIFLFGVEIALTTVDPLGRLLAVGVLTLLMSQVFINMGMTMGLMPITGMTLPLISYGGSSLVVNCAALGLLVNVGQRRPMSLAPRPFEHGRRLPRPHVLGTRRNR
ncbi:hypothetical protein LCGC14_0284900 [marine sediment metagenome]|uniref:Rod shape-determining protein RodA n=1 Tax=marine sediment metagenome TaxID=412755 RepID=A0A0F9WG18_9ZZZZ|nr:rod shape-determining protein RodA [Phycisphaerae bacterium]HDZ45023.1 rod shape-determining protein RodA [Phycisphaerae bacterium]